MKVLCTMPGKFGDILWALPTVRAIADAAKEPVDLILSQSYGDKSFRTLIEGASYILRCVAETTWVVRDTAPLTPQRPETMFGPWAEYDKVIHLGYESWPLSLLPADIYLRGSISWGSPLPDLDLDTPWLVQPDGADQYVYQKWGAAHVPHVHIGWSEEHVELKAGLIYALAGALPAHDIRVITHVGSRLATEWLMHYPGHHDIGGLDRAAFSTTPFQNLAWYSGDWILTAHALANSKLFVGCLSAQWVLANALGIRTVIVEPTTARHNPIFFYNHPRNTMLLGTDGQPTFDARHLVDKVREKLRG